MVYLKILYHIKAFIAKIFYIILYRNRIIFGKNVTWRKSLSIMISKKGKLIIGNNVFFNNYCSINVNNKVVIEDNTIIGEGVKFYDHNHIFNKNGRIKDQGFSNGEIHIGNNCWIGSNVTILKDTNIGDGCIIGAGAIIKGTIPSNTVIKVSSNMIKEKKRIRSN